jgi:hypothetical protein
VTSVVRITFLIYDATAINSKSIFLRITVGSFMTQLDHLPEEDKDTEPLGTDQQNPVMPADHVAELSPDQRQNLWQRSPGDHPVLVEWLYNHRPGRQWMLEANNVIIGRDEGCNLVIQIDEISREHVAIYRDGADYWIEDLNSKNGTWLNSEQLSEPTPLRDSDEINIALCIKLVFLHNTVARPMVALAPHQTADDAT